MARAIALILDGLRRDLISPETTPNLVRFADKASRFAAHRSVFPSATRVVSAAFATGCQPGRNGLRGNTVALRDNGRLALFDVGKPEFFETKRRLTGATLTMPTMAERLAGCGGVVVFNNVSPGAAYAHDPDGHGTIYHRAGSRGPGFEPVAEPLDIKSGIDGDRTMAARFIDEVVNGDAALGVLWLSEPDTVQHSVPLGSPAHLRVLREADAIAGEVMAAVAARDEDILLIVGSDHGHQSVGEIVDIAAFLAAKGLLEPGDDIVIAPNGTGAVIYVGPGHAERIAALHAVIASAPWAGAVYAGSRLAEIGLEATGGLAIAVSMRSRELTNIYGVPGISAAVKPAAGKPDRLGCGQHGGLGTYEQSPFLMISGRGFAPGILRGEATSIVDLAPTILAHLGRPRTDLDGRELQVTSEPDGDQRP
ncbi:alkaline phosphatase family protein [Acuticoccus sp. MNP-M23]|uniref:alkaline phosphatase family protein n=1 Tax=Acuticoccus sp. MNP-M23 TaxID=3072793 RepID=UPI0028153593|nr:alkaline phosphatase family protein [Acuticoccus sp. MNP-M23]WMS41826.1 alkaline phosphatase family protein [Acuticoccus sp. MNP-M23]